MSRIKSVGLPWSTGIGTNVKDCNTSLEVLEKAKLNFTVEKCDLYARMPINLDNPRKINEVMGDFSHDGNVFCPCPNGYATYRTDTNVPLGVVKSKYEVVQNIDAFNFIDSAIGKDKANFQYAGCFAYGHKVFITAKLPITTTVANEPIDNYLVFSTSHDGSSSVDILFTPVRVFCTNCLNSAIKEADSHIRIKHTKSAKNKLEFGADMLRIAIQYAKDSKTLYDSLYAMQMTDAQVMDYIAKLTLSPDEYSEIIATSKEYTLKKLFDRDYLTLEKYNITTRKANILSNLFEYYQTGVAQESILGTAWGAYNAITGYYCNVKEQSGEKRMNSLMFGSDRVSMNKAFAEIVNYNY